MAYQVPTTPENIARITAVYHSVAEHLAFLSDRWFFEKGDEDIRDYQRNLETVLPADIKITAMVKRPFGFKFTIGTDAVYGMYAGGKHGWKRIS